MWAEMKFPPINLYSVWPSKYMIELYDKYNGDDMSALDKQVDGDHYKTPIQPIETWGSVKVTLSSMYHVGARKTVLLTLKKLNTILNF